MSKSAYTSGPWVAQLFEDKANDRDPRPMTFIVGKGGKGARIARMWMQEGEGAKHAANIRLIESAPDLYEALIEVRDNVTSDSPDMWLRVDAAIAKAEGK